MDLSLLPEDEWKEACVPNGSVAHTLLIVIRVENCG